MTLPDASAFVYLLPASGPGLSGVSWWRVVGLIDEDSRLCPGANKEELHGPKQVDEEQIMGQGMLFLMGEFETE
ncbi:unnamed protein product [Lota lota]